MEEREFLTRRPSSATTPSLAPNAASQAIQGHLVVRRKRQQLPRGADERDRARFAKASLTCQT